MIEDREDRAPRDAPLPETVPDVVCGKRVNPRATKWHVRHGEQTFYFCTLSCALRFKGAPHAFQRRIEHATQN
jgi:YHS domain-containing protein